MSIATLPSCCAAAFLLIAVAAPLGASAANTGQRPAAGAAIRASDLEPMANPSLADNAMAQAMGLFAKHGLACAVGPSLGGGGPARVQAIAAGVTDVATSDIISAFGAIHSGADMRVLLVMTPYGDQEVWGRSQVKTMKDALHQTWAVASLAGAQRFIAQMAVEGLGFKPDDFRFVPIAGSDGARLEAIATGRTQLATLSHLGAALARAKGDAVHVLVPHTARYTAPMPRLVVIAKESWIKGHEDEATRYVEVMLDAGRQWQNNAASWVDPAYRIYRTVGLSRQQLASVWQQFRAGGFFTVNGGVNYATTQKVMDLFFKLRNESPNQYLSKPSDVYDTGPLRAALDEMGLAKGTPGRPDDPDWYERRGGTTERGR